MALSAAELSALGQRYHGVGSASPISSNSRYAIVEVGRRLLDLHLPALGGEPLGQFEAEVQARCADVEEQRSRNSEREAVSRQSDEIDMDVDAYGFRVPHMQVGGVTI